MNKKDLLKILFVALILTSLFLTSCVGNNTSSNTTTQDTDIDIYTDDRRISNDLATSIKEAYAIYLNELHPDINYAVSDFLINNYYGTFGQCEIIQITIFDKLQCNAEGVLEVAGYMLSFRYLDADVFAYKEGKIYELDKAYENGFFTKNQIYEMAQAGAFGIMSVTNPKLSITGDFNGDGLCDYLVFLDKKQHAEMCVYLSDGTKFTKEIWETKNYIYLLEKNALDRIVVGDFTGDGKDDICIIFDAHDPKVLVYKSCENSFELDNKWLKPEKLTQGFDLSRTNGNIVAGDFNGDNKDDICIFYENEDNSTDAYVYTSTGTEFLAPESYWSNSEGFSVNHISGRIISGDFNGDSKDDICALYSYADGSSRLFTYISSGNSFELKWNYLVENDIVIEDIIGNISQGDFDGDGKDDICIFLKDLEDSFILKFNGTNFIKESIWQQEETLPLEDISVCVASGDFDGDGKYDIIVYDIDEDGYYQVHVLMSNSSSFTLGTDKFSEQPIY